MEWKAWMRVVWRVLGSVVVCARVCERLMSEVERLRVARVGLVA